MQKAAKKQRNATHQSHVPKPCQPNLAWGTSCRKPGQNNAMVLFSLISQGRVNLSPHREASRRKPYKTMKRCPSVAGSNVILDREASCRKPCKHHATVLFSHIFQGLVNLSLQARELQAESYAKPMQWYLSAAFSKALSA